MTAIQANYCDLKLIKTRKVMQLVLEVPLEHAQQVTETLGWPDPTAESWVAVARLKQKATTPAQDKPERERKQWHELKPSQQCALLCKDERFRDWLRQENGRPFATSDSEDAAANFVRAWLGVKSRAEIDSNPDAARKWAHMADKYATREGQMAEQR